MKFQINGNSSSEKHNLPHESLIKKPVLLRILSLVVAVSLSLCFDSGIGLSIIVNAFGESIAIDETNFPDEVFRNYVSDFYDADKDGYLSESEIAQVTSVYIIGDEIESIYGKGIENLDLNCFSALRDLCLMNCNSLLKLNLSGCILLQGLDLNMLGYDNSLTELDVSGCASLSGLNFPASSRSKLTKLNASGCTSLSHLDINFLSALEELDLSGCTSLNNIYLNQAYALKKLDLSGCSLLESFGQIFCTDLKTINLSGCRSLTQLYCQSQSLVSLNLDGCRSLMGVDLNFDELDSIDLSGSEWLSFFRISGNKLGKLDLSGCSLINNLVINCPQISQIDVSDCSLIRSLELGNLGLEVLNVSGCSQLMDINCSGNQLTSLDISDCYDLFSLYCEDNYYYIGEGVYVYSLDNLSQYGFDPERVLKWNGAIYNSSDNTITLTVPGSGVSGGGAGGGFIGGDTVEYGYDCGKGRVATFKLVANINGGHAHYFSEEYKYDSSNHWNECSCGCITEPLEHIASDWIVDKAATRMRKECIKCGYVMETADCMAVEINNVNFPDFKFREYVMNNFDKNIDGYLSENEIIDVTSINISSLCISDIKGIEHFKYLENLTCSNNQLTSLDISENTALKSLDCEENQLTSLDVSKNTALKHLRCAYNPLMSLDVSKNIALEKLLCKENQLTTLDLTKNTALTDLSCQCNQLTELDVTKNTALINLDCFDNKLTALDVTNNAALESLDCSGNQLTSLDLSQNANLIFFYCNDNSFNIGDVTGAYDLSKLPAGFDPAKASNWQGATYNSADNTITDFTSNKISYKYDCVNGKSATFTLVVDTTHSHDFNSAWETDGTSHWHECSCGKKIDLAEHIPNIADATETEDKICTVCGYVIEQSVGHTHNYGTTWKKDKTYHWKECACGEKINLAGHIASDWITDREATASENGQYHRECTVCGYLLEKAETILHTHNFGSVWDHDTNKHWHSCNCGEKADEADHISDGGVTSVQPTASSTGTRIYTCSVCGYIISTETIPATGGSSSSDSEPSYPAPSSPSYPTASGSNTGTTTTAQSSSGGLPQIHGSNKSGWTAVIDEIKASDDGEKNSY